MTKLSKLEEDFIGDLAQDPHELWELYTFVRHHHPGTPEADVLRLGQELLSTWVNRGWLTANKSRGKYSPLTGEQLLAEVSRLGQAAADPEKGTIVLDLAVRATQDVGWLKTMNNKFSVGDKVEINSTVVSEIEGGEKEIVEKGIVVHWWWNDELWVYDYYVAFFGESFPVGKPDRIPYVLRYAETSLKKAE